MSENKYEFNLSDPDSWSKMPRPYLDESFVKETNRIGGLNKRGEPRFKWVWGMSEEVYIEGDQFIQSGWYLKYQLCTTGNKLVGFRWQSDNGKQHFVERYEDVPAGVITALPVYRVEQIGTPRWILEEWREEGDCNGVYDRAGYYFHRKIVDDDEPENPETFLKPYRAPDQRDLDILAQYVQLTAQLTDNDIKAGVAADREREAAVSAELKRETQQGFAETIEQMITDAPRLPEPPKEIIQKAWKQLEAKNI